MWFVFPKKRIFQPLVPGLTISVERDIVLTCKVFDQEIFTYPVKKEESLATMEDIEDHYSMGRQRYYFVKPAKVEVKQEFLTELFQS